MNKIVAIHGAVNGSNFGDCLFAKLFLSHLKQVNRNTRTYFWDFPRYGISDYLRQQIGADSIKLKSIRNIDLLVLMSGGYFGNSSNSFRRTLRSYMRYYVVCELAIFFKKPIVICGVGGGPLLNGIVRKRAVRIMNHAESITVRDQETADYFRNNGVIRPIEVTSDTALLVKDMVLPPLLDIQTLDAGFVEKLNKEKEKGSKIVFLHIAHSDRGNQQIMENMIPALNTYMKEHPDVFVVLGGDGLCNKNITELEIYNKISGNKMAYYHQGIVEFLAVIKCMDVIITTKLHCGIIGAVFEKSVICFAQHPYKTQRFYKQIGCKDRCILLKDCNEKIVYDQLNRFANEAVRIPEYLYRKAQRNLDIISEVL